MSEKTFFIADTHFGHEAMIRFENRPFENTADMEAKLIQNWNETVGEEDRVFVLGDFAFGDKEEVTRLCQALNGKKTLVLGNHDHQSPEWYRSCGFDEASAWPIIIEGFWILSHEPLYINANMPYANIYGHVHSNPTYKDYCSQSICVCVERIDYRPVNFEEIKAKVLGA
ncbi:MAG: phosphoesterase [Clostridia bacterium]|nr:metallophosphoesterase [Lachnospiraceae bacterium]NCC00478.1 phosphoesterase [Clostridia bacterium]NCD02489.1 phosphoesterase [Clostridia bacterium]